MVIYFIIIIAILNYEQWRSKGDIFNPFHLSSLAVLFYGIGPLVMEITFEDHNYSNYVIWQYFFALNIAIIGLYIPYKIKLANKKLNLHFSNKGANSPYIILSVIFLIFVYKDLINYFIVANGGYENANVNRTHQNDYTGFHEFLFLLFLSIILILILKNVKNKIVGSILVIVISSFSMLAGSRVLMINTLFLVVYHLRKYILKLKISLLIFILTITVIFFTFFNHTRGLNLSMEKKIELFSKIYENSGVLSLIMSGEFTNPCNSVLKVIQGINKGQIDYSYGYYYLADLSAFVPKFILPRLNTIVIDYHLTFYRQEYLEGKGQAFSPIAEAYWNFGFLGILFEFIVISAILKGLYKIFKESESDFIRYCYFITFFSLNFALFRQTLFVTIKYFVMYTFVFIMIEYRSKKSNKLI
jgi:oligosaccharide repeat unit polymerase